MATTAQKITSLSYEDSLKELEIIVRQLEEGQGKLEDAISSYERGVQLKKHCGKLLKNAQMKVEKISLDQEGNLTKEEFDNE
jgi:exodeoxyribonuclease VII small subunit